MPPLQYDKLASELYLHFFKVSLPFRPDFSMHFKNQHLIFFIIFLLFFILQMVSYYFLVFQTLKMGHILPSVFNRLNVMSHLCLALKLYLI